MVTACRRLAMRFGQPGVAADIVRHPLGHGLAAHTDPGRPGLLGRNTLRLGLIHADAFKNDFHGEITGHFGQFRPSGGHEAPCLLGMLAGKGDELDAATHLAIDEWAQKVRARLCDLSWFMRVLNETIARKAMRKASLK